MIPEGYDILEYLNIIIDNRLEFAMEVLRGFNVKHFNRQDVRIMIQHYDNGGVRLLLIAKTKPV